MRSYELLVIISPEVEKEKETAAIEEVVKEAEGKLDKVEDWGRKQLNFPIKGQRVGNYLLLHLQLEPQKVARVRRELSLREGLLRFMVIKKGVTV